MDVWAVDFASTQTLVRAVATALIVIIVTLSVERLGPMIGGALVGLPIVIGPGFFFLLQEHGTDFAVSSASYALLSLCGTQAFLLAYVATAYRYSAGAALLAASVSWIVVATVLSSAPASPALGALMFVSATCAGRLLGRLFRRPVEKRRNVGGPLLLVGRGILAGILVAAVTAASTRLGPGWAGILIAYPIGFTVVSVTLHQRLGPDAAIATLHSAMLGTTSLAVFSGSLAVALPLTGSASAFLIALLLAVGATSVVTAVQFRRSRSM
ncbi:MAG TPA: hypothetical protein VK943_08630 [Arenibaculum sp.]|nr:hypothetical protein [Arenibaculum sp.]